MVRYLRIAIFSLMAAAIMPIPYGMAEDIGGQQQTSPHLATLPLIRVVDAQAQECRRQCDANFAACLAELRRGDDINACSHEHYACYRAC